MKTLRKMTKCLGREKDKRKKAPCRLSVKPTKRKMKLLHVASIKHFLVRIALYASRSVEQDWGHTKNT
jgi:hypothetical protein